MYIFMHSLCVSCKQLWNCWSQVWLLDISFTPQFFARHDASLMNKCLNLNKLLRSTYVDQYTMGKYIYILYIQYTWGKLCKFVVNIYVLSVTTFPLTLLLFDSAFDGTYLCVSAASPGKRWSAHSLVRAHQGLQTWNHPNGLWRCAHHHLSNEKSHVFHSDCEEATGKLILDFFFHRHIVMIVITFCVF